MQILREVDSFLPDPQSPLVLGLGNFDGLHLGHRKLLENVIEHARSRGGKAAVFTFQEHPQSILHPESRPLLLTSPEHRLQLFRETGLDICFFIPFTDEFSRIDPETFVTDIFKKKLNVSKVVLGTDARFGFARKGDSKMMARLAREYGFEFEEILPVKAAGGIVSSSRIRMLVKEGDFDAVQHCLGRSYSLFAKVVRGDGRGKSIGYPTANLDTGSYVLPLPGVYPALIREVFPDSRGEKMPAVLNYGFRPTFETGAKAPVLEAFILDFSGNLYGKTLEIIFYPRLRHEMLFEGGEALKKQIAQDVEQTRRYFLNQGNVAAGL